MIAIQKRGRRQEVNAKVHDNDTLTSQTIIGSRSNRDAWGTTTRSGTTSGAALHLGPEPVVGGRVGRYTSLSTSCPAGHLGAQPLIGGTMSSRRGRRLLRGRRHGAGLGQRGEHRFANGLDDVLPLLDLAQPPNLLEVVVRAVEHDGVGGPDLGLLLLPGYVLVLDEALDDLGLEGGEVDVFDWFRVVVVVVIIRLLLLPNVGGCRFLGGI